MAASRKRGIVVDPGVNQLLTVLFGCEVAGVLYTILVPGRLPAGCPLSPREAAVALMLACTVLVPVIFMVKRLAAAAGSAASRTLLKPLGDPLSKKKSLRKFEDQSWQLFIHVAMTVLEVYVLYYDGGGEPWLRDYPSLWTPAPWHQINGKRSIHVLYLVQMAIWIVTCASHRFVEERHKDYVMMYIHHLVTIMLIWLSYSANYVRIGTVVLFLHDSSDIVIDLLKITNYLKLEGARGCFIVEICFISNFFTWFYTRLYLYPVFVVWYGGWYGTREVITAPGVQGMEEFTAAEGGEYTRGHKPGATIGDGTFNFWINIYKLPTHDNLPLYWILNPLLTALLVMHIIWYVLLWRLLFRLINKTPPSAAARDEYEGDSDDEKDD